MRFRTIILGSASGAVLALVASPAAAQSAQPVPNDPTVQAQESAADPEQGSPQTDDPVQGEGEEIVVTGFRQSLSSTRNIKRNSEQIVDAIVAEDIGKLPDLAVSDTAARIPGRAGRSAGRRGRQRSDPRAPGLYDDVQWARDLHGRNARRCAPGLSVGQHSRARSVQDEHRKPGRAGTCRFGQRALAPPLRLQGLRTRRLVWGLYTNQSGEITPNGNFLFSNRVDTGIGEVGVLVNVSYTASSSLIPSPQTRTSLPIRSSMGQRVRFPDVQRLFYREGDRTRPSVNASLQWRPNDALEFYGEFLYQGFRNKISDRRLDALLFGGQSYTNLVFRDGTNLLESGTVTNPAPLFSFAGGTFNKTDTYQYAVGGRYESGPFTLTGDLARTESRFTGSTESVDRRYCLNGYTADFDLTTPQFTISNCDLNDPANQVFVGLYEEAQVSEGADYQARFDAQYEFDDGFFLRSIQAVACAIRRDAHREFGNALPASTPDAASRSLRSHSISKSPRRGSADGRAVGTETFLVPTYRSIRDNLRAAAIRDNTGPNGGFRPLGGADRSRSRSYTQIRPPYTTLRRDTRGYAQLNFQFGEVSRARRPSSVRTQVGVSGTANVNGVLHPIQRGPGVYRLLAQCQPPLPLHSPIAAAPIGHANPHPPHLRAAQPIRKCRRSGAERERRHHQAG
jgi:hypothetical protein